MTTTHKPLLLIYADGATRVVDVALSPGTTIYEEAVYLPIAQVMEEEPVSTGWKHTVMRRTFVQRGETRRYLIFEEWS